MFICAKHRDGVYLLSVSSIIVSTKYNKVIFSTRSIYFLISFDSEVYASFPFFRSQRNNCILGVYKRTNVNELRQSRAREVYSFLLGGLCIVFALPLTVSCSQASGRRWGRSKQKRTTLHISHLLLKVKKECLPLIVLPLLEKKWMWSIAIFKL